MPATFRSMRVSRTSSRLRWAGAAQGLELVLRPAGPGKLTAKYEVTIERWPAGLPPLPKRPADLMAWGESDSTYVTGERGFAW